MAIAKGRRTHLIPLDGLDDLHKRTAQLAALLSTLCGEGYQSFKDYSEDIQENTLWLASDLADQIQQGLELSTAGVNHEP